MDHSAFQPFGWVHALAVLACAGAMLAACVLGLRWRHQRKQRALELALAASVFAFQIVHQVYWLLPARFDPGNSFPLQLCDLASWLAGLALVFRARWMRTLVYFWAIGLSTQAFVTPIITEGPARVAFWFFWIGHTQIVGVSVYDLVVHRYRPRPRDLAAAVLITTAYAATVFCINIPTGFNYGYVGDSTPENPTIMDALGPWPARVGIVSLIVVALFTALYAVWPIAERLRLVDPALRR